jgi:hypothetical protein
MITTGKAKKGYKKTIIQYPVQKNGFVVSSISCLDNSLERSINKINKCYPTFTLVNIGKEIFAVIFFSNCIKLFFR